VISLWRTSGHFYGHASLAKPLAVLLICCLVGCSTHAKRLIGPRNHFFHGDLTAAQADLEELSQSNRSDRHVAELDLAVVELFEGRPESAEKRLRYVRDQWEELEQKTLADETAILTDDQYRSYSGEIHERLLIGVFLALTSLMQDGVDAEAYTLQTLEKQQQLVRSSNQARGTPLSELFGVPPIAPYLRGVLREATLNNYDDALRMYLLTEDLMPDHPLVLQDIRRVESGVHSPPGHGVVYVIALVGRGPTKVETKEPVTQTVLFQADRLVSMLGNYSVPPTIAPIKIPALVCPPKQFDVVGVELDGQPVATTMPIADLERIASETFESQFTELMVRTVARRIIKKGAVYAAKSQLRATPAASLALDVAGVAWEFTESADTRCWGLLPREIQILRLELPEGVHQLALEPVIDGRPVAGQSHCQVDVMNARNTYVMGFWPDRELVGQLLVNSP
jgi:uncharacterized protein